MQFGSVASKVENDILRMQGLIVGTRLFWWLASLHGELFKEANLETFGQVHKNSPSTNLWQVDAKLTVGSIDLSILLITQFWILLQLPTFW